MDETIGSDVAERRRMAVRAFLAKHRITPKELGRRGGFNPNSIYNFLNRISRSLSATTLEQMVAAVPGATADDLLVPGVALKGRRVRPIVGDRIREPRHATRGRGSAARCPQGPGGLDASNTPQPQAGSRQNRAAGAAPVRPGLMTISEAKLALGATFGVSPAMVEIVIRG